MIQIDIYMYCFLRRGIVLIVTAGQRSGYNGQYRHPHYSKDMGLNPIWGVVTTVHPTVMGYLALFKYMYRYIQEYFIQTFG